MRRATVTAARAAFTLTEVIMALGLGAVVTAAALAGIVGLQRGYAASEQYGAGMADQMRLTDSLAMDLRRATGVTRDADGLGLTLTLPDFYRYDPNDTRRANPLPNTPVVPADHSRALYQSAAPAPSPAPRVVYRFDAARRQVTREEVPAGQPNPTGTAPARQDVAGNMAAFPTFVFDNASTPLTAHVTVSFHPTFATAATPENNTITIHNLTFLRNNDFRSN